MSTMFKCKDCGDKFDGFIGSLECGKEYRCTDCDTSVYISPSEKENFDFVCKECHGKMAVFSRPMCRKCKGRNVETIKGADMMWLS